MSRVTTPNRPNTRSVTHEQLLNTPKLHSVAPLVAREETNSPTDFTSMFTHDPLIGGAGVSVLSPTDLIIGVDQPAESPTPMQTDEALDVIGSLMEDIEDQFAATPNPNPMSSPQSTSRKSKKK